MGSVRLRGRQLDEDDGRIPWFVWLIVILLLAVAIVIFDFDLPGFYVWDQ